MMGNVEKTATVSHRASHAMLFVTSKFKVGKSLGDPTHRRVPSPLRPHLKYRFMLIFPRFGHSQSPGDIWGAGRADFAYDGQVEGLMDLC
jgi:hypothetical protein